MEITCKITPLRTVALASALLLTGCQFVPGTDAHAFREAEAVMRLQMPDPESAKFRNEHMADSPGKRLTCGEVNSRTIMGGYGGYRPFYYDPSAKKGTILPSEDGSTTTDIAIVNFPAVCGSTTLLFH